MAWIFALGVLGFMIGSPGFRRVMFWLAGGLFMLTVIAMIVHKF